VARLAAIADNAISRITHAWASTVTAQADGESFVQQPQDTFARLFFVVLVVTEGRAGTLDLVALQQALGHAGIFAGQRIHLPQNPMGAVGQIFKIADGRGYDE
jgi:hypothetical protein